MEMGKQEVLSALESVMHPGTGKDVVSSGVVARVAACDGFVAVSLALAGLDERSRGAVVAAADGAIRQHAERIGAKLQQVRVELAGGGENAGGGAGAAAAKGSVATTGPGAQAGHAGHGPAAAGAHGAVPAPSDKLLPNVKSVIAVGAGKGGVGKSTVAVNLAVGLALKGHAVGILDGDIYGPSLPTMLGLDALSITLIKNMLQPFLVHGVKAMTIGKLVDPEKALIWRGPMAHGAFKQLVDQTEWGDLDYMIIDLPPGTGDVSLTMAQTLRLTGAVVVCTPQKVAQDDAIRAVRMFEQLKIEVLGVVENMSFFIGDDGKEYDLFGKGGAETMAARLGVPFLGAIPITTALRKNCDNGEPLRNFEGSGPLPRALDAMVEKTIAQAGLADMRLAGSVPALTVS